jgi:hypothetical protein
MMSAAFHRSLLHQRRRVFRACRESGLRYCRILLNVATIAKKLPRSVVQILSTKNIGSV